MARRVDVRPIEVVEVIGYYSMLHRQPVGKYNVQVCTNISCMLRGADELFEHCCKKLGIKHKQTTPDGLFSLEEVECLGACCGAPAMQVNYDYLRKPDAGKDRRADRGIEEERAAIQDVRKEARS